MKRNMRTVVLAALCICLIVSAFAGCADPAPATEPGTTETISYTVSLQTRGGMPIEKVQVRVYSDASQTRLVNMSVTDSKGMVTFTAPASDSYNVVLSKLPGGYTAEDSYTLTGADTIIIPSVGTMTDEDFTDVTYSLGDAVMDFSVTAADGTVYTLSELLKVKKAVVLNFWYLECAPCKMEFPYVQEAYEQFSEDIELIAMNPVNSDPADVAAFQSENALTFPMALCDARWQTVMKLTAYPTTIVIDRFGNICLIHNGMVTETEPLVNMLEHFTSDDYEQQFFETLGEIPA